MAGLGEFLEDTSSRLRPSLSDSEIARVWEYVAQFIEQHLLAEKGVAIGNFGTFTFSRKSLHIGNGFLSVQRPVFNLSSHIMLAYKLTATKHHTSGNVQIVPLNFSAIAADSPYSRDVIQEIVDYITREVPRALHHKKKVDLLVNGVGRLYIKANEVKFRFFREFLNALDDSGKVEQVFRLDTRGAVSNVSVLSRMQVPTGQSRSTSTVVLPRLVSQGRRSAGKPAIVGSFSSVDESQEEQDAAADDERRAGQPSPEHLESELFSLPQPTAPPSEAKKEKRRKEKSPEASTSQEQPTEQPCTHKNSGQELCYLCYQRASRNKQISFEKERQEKERLENHMLADYQRRQQELFLAREQARAMRARCYAKEAQQRNWEVALEKKEEKAAQTIPEASFLIHNRPVSPPGAVLMAEYRQDLKEQIKRRQQQAKEEERDLQINERLERIHLADQLASSEKAYLEKKKKQTEEYVKSLKYQIEHKPELVPATEPDSRVPIFGKDDGRLQWRKNRELAEQIMKEQQALSELKARQRRRSQEEERERDREMLQRARDDLRLDLQRESEIRASVANDLVASWLTEKQRKKRRDLEDNLSRKVDGGQLMEQYLEDGVHVSAP